MAIYPLIFEENNCFYVQTTIINCKERFLVDTGFSSYLCLSSKLKCIFPDLKEYTSFDTEFTLADSSKKIIRQYSIPQLQIFNKKFQNILVSFNNDESILGMKLLEELKAELFVDLKNKLGNIKF